MRSAAIDTHCKLLFSRFLSGKREESTEGQFASFFFLFSPTYLPTPAYVYICIATFSTAGLDVRVFFSAVAMGPEGLGHCWAYPGDGDRLSVVVGG